MADNPLQIVVQIDTSVLAAQISEQITRYEATLNNDPHYLTKRKAVEEYGWSEYHLKVGEKNGFLTPLRMAGKGEIRYSYRELTIYHNQLQSKKHAVIVQSDSSKGTSKSSRNAPASRKRQ